MFALHLHDVGFAFDGGVPLLESVDLHLTPGWTGVVGPNGAGKTTLLRLLAGALTPTAGRVRASPAGLVVSACAQRVDARTPVIDAFAWDWSREAVRLRAAFDLEPEHLERWPTLSPGERKRWQIAAALCDRPGALLLDEPTNHLDAAGRARLIDALRAYDGVGVIVSHDRALLDDLTAVTLRVADGRVDRVAAPYSEAAAAWAAEADGDRQAVTAAQDTARALRGRLGEARRRRDGAAHSVSARGRMKDARDSDGREAGRKGRAIFAEAKVGREVGTLRRATAAAERAAADHDLRAEVGRDLFVDHARAPVDLLAVLDGVDLRAGDHPVLRDVRATLRRDDRVWVAGPNGAGKTTLVRALLDAARVPPARRLWLPQHRPEAAGAEDLAALRALPPDARGRVLQLVAALGVPPDQLLASAAPSPGEARKLALARGLAAEPWLVALDEPTNHLDLPSVERLEAALAAWPGALLLVTHDRALAARLTTTRWHVEGGRVRIE